MYSTPKKSGTRRQSDEQSPGIRKSLLQSLYNAFGGTSSYPTPSTPQKDFTRPDENSRGSTERHDPNDSFPFMGNSTSKGTSQDGATISFLPSPPITPRRETKGPSSKRVPNMFPQADHKDFVSPDSDIWDDCPSMPGQWVFHRQLPETTSTTSQMKELPHSSASTSAQLEEKGESLGFKSNNAAIPARRDSETSRPETSPLVSPSRASSGPSGEYSPSLAAIPEQRTTSRQSSALTPTTTRTRDSALPSSSSSLGKLEQVTSGAADLSALGSSIYPPVPPSFTATSSFRGASFGTAHSSSFSPATPTNSPSSPALSPVISSASPQIRSELLRSQERVVKRLPASRSTASFTSNEVGKLASKSDESRSSSSTFASDRDGAQSRPFSSSSGSVERDANRASFAFGRAGAETSSMFVFGSPAPSIPCFSSTALSSTSSRLTPVLSGFNEAHQQYTSDPSLPSPGSTRAGTFNPGGDFGDVFSPTARVKSEEQAVYSVNHSDASLFSTPIRLDTSSPSFKFAEVKSPSIIPEIPASTTTRLPEPSQQYRQEPSSGRQSQPYAFGARQTAFSLQPPAPSRQDTRSFGNTAQVKSESPTLSPHAAAPPSYPSSRGPSNGTVPLAVDRVKMEPPPPESILVGDIHRTKSNSAQAKLHPPFGGTTALPQDTKPFRTRGLKTESLVYPPAVEVPMDCTPDKYPQKQYKVFTPALTSSNTAEALFSNPINSLDEPMDMDIDSDGACVEGFQKHTRLHPHQVSARAWMRERENAENGRFGGILADDMGLGKTLMGLVRIVDSIQENKQISKTRLKPSVVVCTSVPLMNQWIAEGKKFCPELKFFSSHGPGRYLSKEHLETFDVIITTYATMNNDHKNFHANKRGRDVLFGMDFHRIILDEAHDIRNYTTQKSEASCALQATYRWCFSGTPLYNKTMDLFSLYRFLRYAPYNNLDYFQSHISKPLENKRGGLNSPTEALRLLKIICNDTTLRRTKDQEIDGRRLVELPPRSVSSIVCRFDDEERVWYSSVEARAGANRNPGNVLRKITRLRQACDHPMLILMDREEKNEKNLLSCKLCGGELSRDAEARLCGICVDVITFSKTCTNFKSAKIWELQRILEQIRYHHGKDKTIVYSHWTSMLDLVANFLQGWGIKFVNFDGRMSAKARDASLSAIRDDSAITVALISIKAGGEGLNLTACNHVILFEPWWNQALEKQALDRVYRLGQDKPVYVYKLITENTIESRMLELQKQKTALSDEVLSAAAGAASKTSVPNESLMALLSPSRF